MIFCKKYSCPKCLQSADFSSNISTGRRGDPIWWSIKCTNCQFKKGSNYSSLEKLLLFGLPATVCVFVFCVLTALFVRLEGLHDGVCLVLSLNIGILSGLIAIRFYVRYLTIAKINN